MSLTDALSHAFQHSREFQTAKEELYLAALALSLERHLWTPQLMAQISSQYANYGQVRDFDHAMDMVSQIAVEQRLPYGGEVTARVLNTLMRDLTNHVTTGETGAMIIEANIPLLRGAGRVARESRYQAERDLIYAVRTFEQFRRDLAVDIASDYFQLQQLRQAIVNATESIRSFTLEAERTRALGQTGRLLELDRDRRPATAAEVGAIQVIGGAHNAVSRCFYDGRAKTYMPYFIEGSETSNLLVENCVIINGWNGSAFSHCADLTIRHCVYYNCLIQSLHFYNNADALEEIQAVQAKPRRTDVRVVFCSLAWVPMWQVSLADGQSLRLPAREAPQRPPVADS